MRNTDTYNREILEIEPSTIVCLYNINLRDRGRYLFHSGENGYHREIIFNGEKYDYFPIKTEGFNMSGDGRLPRPKMTFPNQQGNISLRLGVFKDFINYKVTRIKTFVKYLDAENFPNQINPHAEPDPDTSFAEDIFFVNQKTKEDDNVVEFELVSLLELQNASIPARTMYSNYCSWQYRSNIGCGYRGKPIADKKNKKFVPSGYSGLMVGEETYFSGEFLEQNNFAGDGMTYQKWTRSGKYNKGDVVYLEPVDNDMEVDRDLYPLNIYVCLEDNVRSNPAGDTEKWVLDDCDKTLCGCRLRFSAESISAGGGKRKQHQGVVSDILPEDWNETQNGLPYGGFPGIDPYEFK